MIEIQLKRELVEWLAEEIGADPERAEKLAQSFIGMLSATEALGVTGLIWQERMRQMSQEGFTKEHDDRWINGELALAGACYAWPPPRPIEVEEAWPWDFGWWKPCPDTRIRELVKAGALIAAEIDRLVRERCRDPKAVVEGLPLREKG